MTPNNTWSRENPTATELSEFCVEMWRTNLSDATRSMLFALARMSPPARLAHNLSVFSGLISVTPEWRDILRDGLTEEERNALCELDAATLTVRAKEIAHGLLNVHSRWVMMRALKQTFTETWCRRRHFLGSVRLEDVL